MNNGLTFSRRVSTQWFVCCPTIVFILALIIPSTMRADGQVLASWMDVNYMVLQRSTDGHLIYTRSNDRSAADFYERDTLPLSAVTAITMLESSPNFYITILTKKDAVFHERHTGGEEYKRYETSLNLNISAVGKDVADGIFHKLQALAGTEATDSYRKSGYEYYRNGAYGPAIANYSRLIRLRPDDEDAFYFRGLSKMADGDLDGAIADLTASMRSAPNRSGLDSRGLAEDKKGDFDSAIADFDKALELSPGRHQIILHRAHALLHRAEMRAKKSDYDGAIADYISIADGPGVSLEDSEIKRIQQDLVYLYYHRAMARKEKGNLDGAKADFGKAIELSPNFTKAKKALDEITREEVEALNQLAAYLDSGKGNFDKGDFAGAIADYTKVIELKPDAATGFMGRGMARHFKRDFDGAIADYTKAIGLNSGVDGSLYVRRGDARRNNGDFDGAIADFSKAIELMPNDESGYLNRGLARLGKGDPDQAIADCTVAIRLGPTDGRGLTFRGDAYRAKRNYGLAIADYSAALRLNPDNADAYNGRGNAYMLKGDHDRAVADFGTVIRLNPKFAPAYDMLAWELAASTDEKVRDGPKAVEYATKACELAEWKSAGYIDSLAAACAEAGKFDEAIKWEKKYREFPNLSASELDRALVRLSLYQQDSPYHADGGAH